MNTDHDRVMGMGFFIGWVSREFSASLLASVFICVDLRFYFAVSASSPGKRMKIMPLR
jgi:hypothetical protein